MKILVLAENYTNLDGVVALHYIHTRNVIYLQNGHKVDVLSFRSDESYCLEGVNVFPEKAFNEIDIKNYDLVLSHAPNLKNHYRFIKKNSESINKLVIFFHGHEVMDTVKLYPKEYSFVRTNRVKTIVRKIYDRIKLKIWRDYIKNNENLSLVFVSNWMLDMFLDQTKLELNNLKSFKIIPNSIGKTFEEGTLNPIDNREFDVITIRNNIDGSKYCIDLVVKMANANPGMRFLVVGLGNYFNYFSKPENLVHIEKNLKHEEVILYLNKAKICYLPTRLDAQGVMACEIATLGMPMITSNLPICIEMMKEFTNVVYLDNLKTDIDISHFVESITSTHNSERVTKFYSKNTIEKELDFFESVANSKDLTHA